jgi:hypothetical protein
MTSGACTLYFEQFALRLSQPGALLEDVEVLAGGDLGAHPVEFRPGQPGGALVRRGGEALVEEFVAPAEQEVAEEDRRGAAELGLAPRPAARCVQALEELVRGCRAAAGVGVVDDVVVHERRRMEDLQRCGRGDGGGQVGVRRPGALPAPVAEQRPEALATAEKLP